ncbi:PREDICTED: neuropeptide Y receptor-like [Nicrophorus vespilloides]|uniref:Neuropeptide Y receptor-like n=1 Tax=Nicrophorus vespilloides TaxID=110193 RepID=A0ABM1M8D4_NICVS|nr:PREDICTED: neuropeptide Y receptor-like [Nicrophorus vespilloides]
MEEWNETFLNETYNFTDCSLRSGPLKSPYFLGVTYTMYSIVFAISLFGNGMICYIVISSPRMRTVTNFFIMNLAIGDILITILCIPFTTISYLLQYWPFSFFLCPFVNYSQGVSVFVSAYTLVAISIDRYIAIMWPLRPRLSKKSSAIIIAIVWFVATFTVIPSAITSKVDQPDAWFEQCDL